MPFQSPQLAKTFDPKKPPKFPVFVEPKLDGLRAYVIPATGQVFSRNGKPFQNFGHIVEQLKSIPEAMNYVFDGEALAELSHVNGLLRRGRLELVRTVLAHADHTRTL